MCLKHVHSGSSLSGALIVNLWLSFDSRFDYRFFLRPKATRLLGSSFSDYRFWGGAISFSMLSYDVKDTWDPSLPNSISCILTVAHMHSVSIPFMYIESVPYQTVNFQSRRPLPQAAPPKHLPHPAAHGRTRSAHLYPSKSRENE